MIITTEGIVLRQRKIANNRRMIVLFTKRYGKLSAGTSINEKSRSRSALALRPFTYAEYDIFKGRESYSINSASVSRSFFSIGEDVDRFMAASAFIEYLDKVLAEGEPAPKLFDLSLEFLQSVSQSKSSVDTLLFAFIFKTFRMLGVAPELGCCVDCGKAADRFFVNDTAVTDSAAYAATQSASQASRMQAVSDPRMHPAANPGTNPAANPGTNPAANPGTNPAAEPGTNARRTDAYKMFSVSGGGIICPECAEQEKTNSNSLIYRPGFDIITVFRYFESKPLKTFEKVDLRKNVSSEVREILAEYTDRWLGVDVLRASAGLEFPA